MKRVFFLVAAMLFALLPLRAEAAEPYLVKDINTTQKSSSLSYLTNVNGELYFAADDGTHGHELWKSDGTESGTVLVKDIRPGPDGSLSYQYEYPAEYMTDVNGVLYFTADDGTHGRELWKSDGTVAGTVLVKDIFPGSDGSYPDTLTNVNGVLYFAAYDGTHGRELWKSDGTEAGTVLVKDIFPGSDGSFMYGYVLDDWYLTAYMTDVNGVLYFIANDGTHGNELWKSDGTESGTVLVKDIQSGSGSSFADYDSHPLTNVNGVLYFAANDGTHGYELWKSNGTEAGTVLVKDIYPYSMTNVNGVLYFTAYDETHRYELWKSDGTEAGTVLVKDIYNISSLTNVNGVLYFVADDGTHGYELWKSDGTEAGTVLVKDIYNIYSMTNVNGVLYFTADDGTHGWELWKSDGTEAGTVLVKDIQPGPDSSLSWNPYCNDLTNVNGVLYFFAYNETHGWELWKSDGTETGTVLVKDIFPGSYGSYPHPPTNVNGELYFFAYDGTHGQELWKSDGTEAGTVLVKDIRPGPDGSLSYQYQYYEYMTDVNGVLYLTADDGTHGWELWRSDGTEAGTVLVKDIYPGSDNSYPSSLTNMNGVLYFVADDGTHGRELWKSDGTVAGTVLVKDILDGSYGSSPSLLTNVNGVLYFRAYDEMHGRELWKSDGTEAGTVLVKDIYPGSGSSSPSSLTNVNGVLYFVADDGTHGRELWKSDGTEAGTVLVKDIYPGSDGSLSDYSSHLTNVNGVLYFRAYDETHGYELWKSNGTEAGTVLVKDIYPGSDGSLMYGYPYYLTDVNGVLYFTADDGTHGNELWKSDGTEAGTVLVKDIYPDSGSSLSDYYSYLTNVNGTLCFVADDGTHGNELWKSDGTEAGTVLVKDIYPGSDGSLSDSYSHLTNVNGVLYFAADDGTHGKELWAYAPSQPGFLPAVYKLLRKRR